MAASDAYMLYLQAVWKVIPMLFLQAFLHELWIFSKIHNPDRVYYVWMQTALFTTVHLKAMFIQETPLYHPWKAKR